MVTFIFIRLFILNIWSRVLELLGTALIVTGCSEVRYGQ